jgi:hypothetical protein
LDSGATRDGATGQDFERAGPPTRSLSLTVTMRRPGGRADSGSTGEQPSRPRVTHPRAEARRRLAAATELIPAVSDVTQMLPSVPVIEGYGGTELSVRDGRSGRGRAWQGELDARPRPRTESEPADDRQPARSTVYVSRHAADPG